MAASSLPRDIHLTDLERHLAARFPGLLVSAKITAIDDGELRQRIRFEGPVATFEHTGLATRERLETLRAQDGRRRPLRDACGSELTGGIYQDERGEHGTFGIWTTIETAAEEHLPRWAEVAGERLVRRLRKASKTA
jgi:hypothetical protein